MVTLLLNKAGRLFQTDIRYVIKNGGWLLAGQVLLAIMGFGLTVAFANLLPQQEYGVYKFIIAAGGLLAALRLNGLRLAVTQAVALYYYLNDNNLLAIGILLVGSYNAIIGALRVYRGYLAGTEQFRSGTIHDLVTTGLASSSILLALWYTDDILILVMAGITLPLIAIAWFCWRTLRQVLRDAETSASALTFGKHMSAQNFLLNVGVHLDKVILFQWLGSVQLAIYAFALLLPDHVGGLFKSVMGIVVPKFAQKNRDDMRRSISRKLWQLTALMIIPVIGYIVVAPFVFSWLFPVYTESVWYSQLLILGLLGFPASYLFTAYFDALQATRTLYKIKISSSVLKIFFILICTWTLGLLGAVLAHLFARIVTVGILGYYYLTDSRKDQSIKHIS